MQPLNFKLEPLKVTIPGKYYDSQIYDGKLYLWKADGSILTLDWDRLIDNLDHVPERLKITLQFALQAGEDLYHNLLFKDNSHRKLILKKFQKLAELQIEIPPSSLMQFKVTEKDNRLPFPHADSAVHYKTVYVGSQSGVSASNCGNFIKEDSSKTDIKKICDLPVVSLSASNNILALGGGSEGLYECNLTPDASNLYSPKPINNKHSSFVRWFYPSIFSSSYEEGLFADFELTKKNKPKNKDSISVIQENSLELFLPLDNSASLNQQIVSSSEKNENKEKDKNNDSKNNRHFKEFFPVDKIFTNINQSDPPLLTWGVSDKICLLKKSSIDLVKYFPKTKAIKNKFVSIGSVETKEPIGDIISADSSFFGIVLEQEDGLLIITSSLDYIKLPGEPVNWRVFPKSRNYINQLHVIYEDYLLIYSFNHDFFINQSDKKIGISFGSKDKE
jgi:hypothetical protein